MGLEEIAFALKAGQQEGRSTVSLKVIRRGKDLLLLLPRKNDRARKTMTLYAAQRKVPRFLSHALDCWLSTPLPIPLATQELPFDPDSGFMRFLSSCGADLAGEAPFGILAGNPHVDARRWLFMTFKRDGCVGLLVKAGFNPHSKERIRHEYDFLKSLPDDIPHVVRPQAFYDGPDGTAFAMPWVDGRIPGLEDPLLPKVFLADWLDRKSSILVCQSALWIELLRVVPEKMKMLEESGLGHLSIHPSLFHGDLAPWNVRIDAKGKWWIFDWERGEKKGLPGMDWLHYHIQNLILVRKFQGPKLRHEVEKLLGKDYFHSVLADAGLAGQEHSILRLYLLALNHLIKPAEGGRASMDILNQLEQ